MKANLYFVTAITNLHAGSGDTDFSVIDKLVQRDALTGLPCVYSQSMKGSIREYFEGTGVDGKFMDAVFGKTNKTGGKTAVTSESKSGEFVFLQANLLSLPVRSDTMPFYRVTTHRILQDLYDLLISVDKKNPSLTTLKEILTAIKSMKLNNNSSYFSDTKEPHFKTPSLEDKDTLTSVDWEFNNKEQKKLLGDLLGRPYAIVSDKNMCELSDNLTLPVIARNCLENGQSTNLWYEQILPRQTRFTFLVLTPPSETVSKFDETLNDNLIQIGANASVGYGLCEFKKQD
jgi:CRISPR-associated protein Cmr4